MALVRHNPPSQEKLLVNIIMADDLATLGAAAADEAASAIVEAIENRGQANVIVATGASQFEMLSSLVAHDEIDWSSVVGFHLDEYLDLPATHPASFRRYLRERFVDQVPLKRFHYIEADAGDARGICDTLGRILEDHPIDVACVGIGENGHLAFNDPPADFETDEPYLVVSLDEACRRQQLGEGWFATLEDVPRKAISMSVKQILRSNRIVCTVPDERKALAIVRTVEGPVTPHVPASILQTHPAVTLFLDPASADLMSPP